MKAIFEFLPLLAFFFAFKQYGIITATIILAGLSTLSTLILYIKTKTLSPPLIISTIFVVIFGFMTWYFNDPLFIKIKPTIINLIFALSLFAGYYYKKPFMKHLFAGGITLLDRDWLILTLRFAFFFVALAIINEFVWRNFSEDFWVKFKVFGFMPISIAFTLSQMPFIVRAHKNLNKENELHRETSSNKE